MSVQVRGTGAVVNLPLQAGSLGAGASSATVRRKTRQAQPTLRCVSVGREMGVAEGDHGLDRIRSGLFCARIRDLRTGTGLQPLDVAYLTRRQALPTTMTGGTARTTKNLRGREDGYIRYAMASTHVGVDFRASLDVAIVSVGRRRTARSAKKLIVEKPPPFPLASPGLTGSVHM